MPPDEPFEPEGKAALAETAGEPLDEAEGLVADRVDHEGASDEPETLFRLHPTRAVQAVDDAAARLALGLRRHPTSNRAMYLLSSLGDDGRIWVAASALEAAMSDRPQRRFGHAMAWLGLESFVVNKVIKLLVRRARPVPLTEHEHHLRIPRDSSFPSGHAASAATMATILWEPGPRGVAYIGLAGAIGLSRVAVGVHHGSDVIAGWLVGWGFGVAARRWR